MERFEGNGAECMVRFIADGCKGEVKADMGRNKGIVVVCPKTWEMTSSFCTHPLDWLAAPCAYYPPEPVWSEVTPGQALDAWLAGKTVQRKHTPDEHRFDGEEWATLIPDGQHGRPHLWQAHHEYRVQEYA